MRWDTAHWTHKGLNLNSGTTSQATSALLGTTIYLGIHMHLRARRAHSHIFTYFLELPKAPSQLLACGPTCRVWKCALC
jgi:hypothetical protein